MGAVLTSSGSRYPALVVLGRWLGPWSDPARAPDAIVDDEVIAGLRIRVYRPRREPRATYLIAPGLHYQGPDDPRLDRFCKILAAAGHLVVAPFIPDYLALTPCAGAKRDFARAFAALPRWSSQRPVVFSISFGSLLAFALAAEHADALDGLVIFGGYADFHATMRFCLAGEGRDPLNQPVVFANLVDTLEPPPADPAALVAAWRRYVEATWGRPELKQRARYTAIAHALAPEVPASVREMFLVGVGARPGSLAVATAALARFDASALDPTPYLARIRGRVDLVHGTDDDVIPFEHSHELAAKLVNAEVRVHITGMYGHTGAARGRAPPVSSVPTSGAARPSLRALAHELVTLVRVLRVLAR